jgi:SsrA-binding protein
MVLTGTEVKSLRLGRASLAEAFATVDDGEVWLRNAHIPEYTFGTWTNHATRRNRKLLLHKKEIAKLDRETAGSGRTIVPLAIYFSDGYAKVELAVGTGKKDWDKRQTIAARDADRDLQRDLAERNRGAR